MTTLPDAVHTVLARLESAGFAAYAVGGCVRDGLRGIAPHDFDLCTAATPAQIHCALADFSVRDTGLRHGTVTAFVQNIPIEITTFRTEAAYSDGRRPDSVTFVPLLEADLARRDFTIGAIAYSPTRGLCDPFGGQADLEQGILRCVGNPDARFREDALRILRGVRLIAEQGFFAEQATADAMRRNGARLREIAPERLFAELTRILCGRYAGRALREFSSIIAQFCPVLTPLFAHEQFNAHHLYDIWEHTVRTVENVPPTKVLRLAALLHDCGKPDTFTRDENGVGHFYGHAHYSRAHADELLARMRCDNEARSIILLLVEQHDRPLGDSPRLIRRRLLQIGEARFRDLLALKKGDCVGQGTHPEAIRDLLQTEALLNAVLRENHCFSRKQLAISGEELQEIGLSGKAIGDMLNLLLEHVLECPEDNNTQALRAWARRAIQGACPAQIGFIPHSAAVTLPNDKGEHL